MIRVLVVDDAVVIRRLLSEIIESDPELELAGIAPNGRIALSRIEQLEPDVVTLDIEMPELDGLETLVEIRKDRPRLPVIMFSTLTERGASSTLEALARGASDYVTKPANVGSVSEAMDRVRAELVPKIKALCAPRSAVATPAAAVVAAPRVKPPTGHIDIVAIGCSTGGPNALSDIVPALPADLGVPVVITQHMPPVFTRFLAERLDACSPLHVREAEDGAAIEPGEVVIAEGDHHLVLRRSGPRVIGTFGSGPPEHSCRPAVDVMFRSVGDVYGGNVLAVVLTGMGYDGQAGCEQLRGLGAQVVAQDRASSVVWGMPGAVASAGLADAVIPLDEIVDEITRRVRSGSRLALRGA